MKYGFEFTDFNNYHVEVYISELECKNLKDAVLDAFKYTDGGLDLFKKALKGFEDDDVKGFVELYNKFSCYKLTRIFTVGKIIYTKGKENEF